MLSLNNLITLHSQPTSAIKFDTATFLQSLLRNPLPINANSYRYHISMLSSRYNKRLVLLIAMTKHPQVPDGSGYRQTKRYAMYRIPEFFPG
jgi:hypothetical protein